MEAIRAAIDCGRLNLILKSPELAKAPVSASRMLPPASATPIAIPLSAEWSGQACIIFGSQDLVMGTPVMRSLEATIRGAPGPLVLENAGDFRQVTGEAVVVVALATSQEC